MILGEIHLRLELERKMRLNSAKVEYTMQTQITLMTSLGSRLASKHEINTWGVTAATSAYFYAQKSSIYQLLEDREHEGTSKMPRGGVNRQSAAKNYFKTVRRRLSPETPGISPETLGFLSGVSGPLSQRLRV